VRCAAYLRQRRPATTAEAAFFLSESPRNRAQPLSLWTWAKVVQAIARRAGVAQFTTHTVRHLCLTDLARTGWDAAAIARFAGHRTPSLARRYLRLAESPTAPAVPALARWRAEQCVDLLFHARA
jgi:integrase/recombinase XerD